MDRHEESIKDISIPLMIILGFTPGLVVLLSAIFLRSPFFGIGLSLLMAGNFAMILGHLITELGILRIIAWKENKNIKDIIHFNNKTPLLKLLVSVIVPLIVAITVFAILSECEHKFWKIFDFIPDWFRMGKIDFSEINNLKIVLTIYFILNGFLVPIIEEIYFRGYLLPRMQKFGKLAPLINSIIFSLYHFFSPFEIITRILAMTPLIYSVWINKDKKIGIIVHCIMNNIGHIFIIISLLQ
jgi:membrane protease YdiL (CAAX protease family)